ncbi:acyl-CoA carboxylase epsilon subunit [Kitasatospora sp. NBC_01287]|uniref:acyl-CoA carboxylase epsilon subunit n=1 Tax=Kitasatospora sp. NBC_01287 TaxID=2903573 RepID=UPI00224E348C|nr:acyl-CoA carboxylase epsilon subunit [Kitasatospora sp. NBC_01287]MCX4746060.1 acyl-CoA carboxylase epsilon subunit [Kitasatospora sp. NBC_01287]
MSGGEGAQPLLRVLHGCPDEIELAIVTAVLLAAVAERTALAAAARAHTPARRRAGWDRRVGLRGSAPSWHGGAQRGKPAALAH